LGPDRGAMLLGPVGIVAGLFALVRSSLNASATVENLEIAFTTLAGGNAAAAAAHIQELRDFAIGKPFEFTQLAEQSRLLQTYGFAMRDVTGLLRDFGDAAFTANTGYVGVNTMSRVFGQVHAAGRITFGQINQLHRTGEWSERKRRRFRQRSLHAHDHGQRRHNGIAKRHCSDDRRQ
jgi:phage tail tape-measure protein